MLENENRLYNEGFKRIAGIDEVGRGCLAGDVVACAIIMPRDEIIEGITDSKKLSPKKRDAYYDKILESALAIGIGRVDVRTIDQINIKQATRLAMKLAVENLRDRQGKEMLPDYLLVDAEEINIGIRQEALVKGDLHSYSIACASIVAKVYRDRLCPGWDEDYPGYNMAQHKGYGTPEHIKNLKEKGPSPIHRLSFLKNILKGD